MEERNSENQIYDRLCGKSCTTKLGYDEADYMRTVEKDLANYQTYIEDDIKECTDENKNENVEQNIVRSANRHIDYDSLDICQKDISIQLEETHLYSSCSCKYYQLYVDCCNIDVISVIYFNFNQIIKLNIELKSMHENNKIHTKYDIIVTFISHVVLTIYGGLTQIIEQHKKK